jgi:hypothetical protein
MKKLVWLKIIFLMVSIAKADVTKQADNYKIHSQQLDAIPRIEGHYESVELFKHKKGITVLCLCDLDREWEMRLFSFNGNLWSNSRIVCEPYQQWHGLAVDDSFQVYSMNVSDGQATISFYPLDESNKLSETPTKILSFKTNEKYFPKEVSRDYLRVIAIDSNELFIIGKYTESKMNPITFLGALMSGGHSGYASRLFGMRVHDNTILGQYNIPERIGNNDYAVLESAIGTSHNIFIGWIKRQNYSFSSAIKWMCAKYDLTENRWGEPVELFHDGGGASYSQFYDGPFMAIDNNNVLHSVWSYGEWKLTKPVTIGEGSGVFYRSGYESLAKTRTVTDAVSTRPRIIADKNGKIHVFWTQDNTFGTQDSGLFHWQPDGGKVDLLIREQRVGSLDAAVTNDDVNIVFVKFDETSRSSILEYVKVGLKKN